MLNVNDEVDRDKLGDWLDQITCTAEYADELLMRLRNFVNRAPLEPTEVELVETTGSMVEVSVTDNGLGLPTDSDLRIFETFASTKPEGMGLGLAISKTIIETYGGAITAKNRRKHGAEFRFTLPIRSEN